MPFDVHDFPDASRMDRAATRQSRRLVAIWLFTVAGMIAVMIVLGGVTRLTGSGLSIMEWAPIMGILPPSDDAECERHWLWTMTRSLVNRKYEEYAAAASHVASCAGVVDVVCAPLSLQLTTWWVVLFTWNV